MNDIITTDGPELAAVEYASLHSGIDCCAECGEHKGNSHTSSCRLGKVVASLRTVIAERDALKWRIDLFVKAAAEAGYTSTAEDAFAQVAQAIITAVDNFRRERDAALGLLRRANTYVSYVGDIVCL